jgi:hypothetical protein
VFWFLLSILVFTRYSGLHQVRKPEYLAKTRIPGEDHNTWREPEYLVKTRLPGESQNTWRKPENLMKTRLPGENQNTW